MNVKFISTTHPLGKSLPNGLECELKIDMKATFLFNPMKKETITDENGVVIENGEYFAFELRKGYWTTSQIENIEFKEESNNYFVITIKTRNNSYIFTKGEPSNKKPLTKDEILGLKIKLGQHLI